MKRSLVDVADQAAPDPSVLAEVIDQSDSLPVAQVSMALSLGQVSGPVEARDIMVPRFALTQSIGPLSENFAPGSFVYNGEALFLDAPVKDKPSPALEMMVLSLAKFFEEVLPYVQDGPRPRTFLTQAEVTAAGLWTDWRNNDKPPVREVANLMVAIKKPEGIASSAFCHTLPDGDYALAMWTVRSTAYTRVAKVIISKLGVELRIPGLLAGRWTLSAKRETHGGNLIWVPVLQLSGRNSPEFIKEIQAALA